MQVCFLLAFALALVGCAYHPDGDRPDIDLPATLAPARAIEATVWPDAQWWNRFDSTELDGLIAQARERNQDLAAAITRVRQAGALARIAGAPLLPAVGFGANIIGQSYNSSTGATTGIYPDATLTTSFEIDFWGRNSAGAAAARASLRASRFDRETVALTVTADVASRYFQVLAAREQTAIARDNLATAQTVLAQVDARARAGTALAREVAQQRALAAMQQAAIPPLEQVEIEALAALAILLGRPPQGFAVSGAGLGSITTTAVTPGLPSELLTRRPDIAFAEAQLSAAKANVAAARAAMLPHISLTGAAGVQSAALSSVTGGTSFLYALAAGLAQPIFDNGALAGQLEYARARQDELTANYRSAVLAAFADVQRTLQAITHLAAQQAAQEEVVSESQRAFELASVQYRTGAEEMLTVLDTQRTLYAAQGELSQVRLARLQALVGLYKALGGGWQEGGS